MFALSEEIPLVDPTDGGRRLLAALADHRAAPGGRRDPPRSAARSSPRPLKVWGHVLGTAAADRVVRDQPGAVPPAHGPRGGRPSGRPAPLRLDPGRLPRRGHGPALRPADLAVPAADHRRRIADPRLLHRLHGARRAAAAVLRLPQPVRRGDADAGDVRELPRPVHRLGGRRSGVVPADRLLAAQALGRGRRQEGLRDQPGRRHGPLDRDHAGVRHVRLHQLHRDQRRRRVPPTTT